ncbi:MAG TPA: DUF58 domain-containing protein, partial [Chthonomonadales bacterium]|nr:DUF58 domain-containing protein [Chthonomonadales bacterium]
KSGHFGSRRNLPELLRRAASNRMSQPNAKSQVDAAVPSASFFSPVGKFLRPQDLRQYRNLLFAAKMVVEGFYAGKHRSPYHDFSAEFADYRPYVPGDEIRAVDWRAAARTDRIYVKLFRKETDMSAYILVDKSASMGFQGEQGVSKYEYCAYLAAAISYLMLQQGDKPGLSLCDDGLRSFLPPRGTLAHLQGLMHGLERTIPSGPTHVSNALRTLFPLAKHRGLLIVLSDFLEDPTALFHVLGMFLHRKFSVLLFHVLTEEELYLPGTGTARFTDPEGPGALTVEPEVIRTAYRSELQAHLDALSTGAKARRIRYDLLTTATPYYKALSAYLTTRGR